jgi:hypothetical protein
MAAASVMSARPEQKAGRLSQPRFSYFLEDLRGTFSAPARHIRCDDDQICIGCDGHDQICVVDVA